MTRHEAIQELLTRQALDGNTAIFDLAVAALREREVVGELVEAAKDVRAEQRKGSTTDLTIDKLIEISTRITDAIAGLALNVEHTPSRDRFIARVAAIRSDLVDLKGQRKPTT